MLRATPASSSSSSASSSAPPARRPRMRQVTREQLLKSLQILGPVSAPLPSELPPSPPASREPSPAHSLKRRADSHPERAQSKRPRTASISSAASSRPHPPPSRPALVASSKHEPSEDGELREEPSSHHGFAPISFPTNFPSRRPRRGKPSPAESEVVFQKCFTHARMLKYSAYARVAAAHPPSSKDYKPLRVPPNPHSSYATHSLLMARLELIESLLNFVYGIWCKEYCAQQCNRAAWRTMEDALKKTEEKVMSESRDDREKAFLGLIQMIHGFIHGRKLRYNAIEVDARNSAKLTALDIQATVNRDKKAAAQSQPATNMLPSPSSSTSGSSNSTPLGGHGAPAQTAQPNIRTAQSTAPPEETTIQVNARYIWLNKSQSLGVRAASERLDKAQATLNLPIMAKHFPRTFARMINTSLTVGDEHEPDLQDDECELFWPGQSITGEGLGWVCLMGMSMVREFGREYGYQGVQDVVPRMHGDENLGHQEPQFVVGN